MYLASTSCGFFLYAFVIDRLTQRPEVADVRTSVVYEHIRSPVIEPATPVRPRR